MAGKDIQAGPLFIMSFVGAAIVLMIVLVLMVLYYGAEHRLEYERTISQPYVDTERALLDQRARLEEYQRLADVEEFGATRPAYRVPINDAMRMVLADWESGALPGKTVEASSAAGDPPQEVQPLHLRPPRTPLPRLQRKRPAARGTKQMGSNIEHCAAQCRPRIGVALALPVFQDLTCEVASYNTGKASGTPGSRATTISARRSIGHPLRSMSFVLSAIHSAG